MSRLSAGFLLGFFCLGAGGGEPLLPPSGVDPALQKRIDEAIVKARACLVASRDAKARGWGYVSLGIHGAFKHPLIQAAHERGSYATMSAAGLTALLVAKSELELKPGEKALVDQGIRDGLAWFQANWSLPCEGYLLYGVERLGVLGNLHSLGDHSWYPEGAEVLVDAQAGDGRWSGSRYGPGVETAFGLLFLCRGTRSAYALSSYEVSESPAVPPAK